MKYANSMMPYKQNNTFQTILQIFALIYMVRSIYFQKIHNWLRIEKKIE